MLFGGEFIFTAEFVYLQNVILGVKYCMQYKFIQISCILQKNN